MILCITNKAARNADRGAMAKAVGTYDIGYDTIRGNGVVNTAWFDIDLYLKSTKKGLESISLTSYVGESKDDAGIQVDIMDVNLGQFKTLNTTFRIAFMPPGMNKNTPKLSSIIWEFCWFLSDKIEKRKPSQHNILVLEESWQKFKGNSLYLN